MIGYLLHFYLAHLLLNYTDAEPLDGHNALPVNVGEFPFVASLGRKAPSILDERTHFCSGVLISKRRVLTAAHCLKREKSSEIDAVIGQVDLREVRSEACGIDSWITYRKWARNRRKLTEFDEDDVAIIKLSSAVSQKPVSLTKLNTQYGTEAVIVGWGLTNEIQSTYVLLKSRVRILRPEECEEKLKLLAKRLVIVPKNYICNLADPHALVECGDSGGPLLDENNRLLGITRSTSCPSKDWDNSSLAFVNKHKVNIHMDINYYLEFIEDVAKIRARPRQIVRPDKKKS